MTNYARRKSYGWVFGHGFNSRRLHQLKMRNRKGYENHVDTLYSVFTWFLFLKKFTGSIRKSLLSQQIDKAKSESSLLKNNVEIAKKLYQAYASNIHYNPDRKLKTYRDFYKDIHLSYPYDTI